MADKEQKSRDDEADDKAHDEGGAEDNAEAGDEQESSDEGEAKAQEGGDEGEGDEAAQRVAKALGVGDEDEGDEGGAEEGEKAEEEKRAPNRAERRREAALRRKKKGSAAAEGSAAEGAASDDEPLPKDKNQRAKELLKRRREQAAEASAPATLMPGEMVDDALARTSSALTKWLRKNASAIQWVVAAAIVGGGGFLFYSYQTEKTAAAASDVLADGLASDKGRIMAEDKRSDDEKEYSPGKVFKTSDERADTALASYRKVAAEHAGSGAAILARLAEGGVLLDKRDYPKAMDAFSAVLATPLAGADLDVKGRAIEGLGLAKEGKGDLDGALASFKEMQGIDMRGYKELGQIHEARVLMTKGDKEKAKEVITAVYKKVSQPSSDGKLVYVEKLAEDMLRKIDPAAAPAKQQVVGGGPKGSAMSQEEIERYLRKLQDAAKKKNPEQKPHDDH